MSGFTDDWLSLREAVDHRSRAVPLVDRLRGELRGVTPLRVIDLGTGTGSNLRALAPQFDARQTWRLVDHDAVLLDRLSLRLADWATRHDYVLDRYPEGLRLVAERLEVDARTEPLDLVRDLDALDFANSDLVTAAALLDLTSGAWVEALTDKVRRAHAVALFAMNYDGRIEWHPAHPDDAFARDTFNTHQRTDKGFGPSLGPRSGARLCEALERVGYRTLSARSDWVLGVEEPALQQAFLDGQAEAVAAYATDATTRIDAWRAARRDAIAAGESMLRVGHLDVLGLPPVEDRG